MKVTIFGSTGDLGGECLLQCLEAGHEVRVLVRSPEKIPENIRERIAIVKGDALSLDDVMLSIPKDTDAILFAIGVDEKTPSAFVVQTKDDTNYYRSSLAYAAALDAHSVDVELHLFARGGHGYGLRPSKHPVSQWPGLCEAWMRESGFLK